MNKPLFAFLLVSAGFASGCGVDCGDPSQINGRYAIFANVIEWEVSEPSEAFPSYKSPANGWAEWTFEWNQLKQPPVIVSFDGQPYEGDGTWDPVECGNFNLEWSGTYLSDSDSTHAFSATAQFVQFADQIEGQWTYEESWTAETGETGTFTVTAGQLSGHRVEEM